jgi:hypothetical protein
MGNKGKYDRNLTYKNKALRNLVKDLNKTGTVGLHPSYLSNSDVSILKAEKAMLEDILQEKVSKSRQHYIKISLPKTYQNLISLGISEDYSMGYPSVSGFRAGTSTPFYFYNLQEEEISSLKVFPFVFMDTTLKVYLKKRSKDIIPCLKPYIEVVKQYGGCLSFIFHNESLGCCGKWKNWNGIYEEIIRLCIDNK